MTAISGSRGPGEKHKITTHLFSNQCSSQEISYHTQRARVAGALGAALRARASMQHPAGLRGQNVQHRLGAPCKSLLGSLAAGRLVQPSLRATACSTLRALWIQGCSMIRAPSVRRLVSARRGARERARPRAHVRGRVRARVGRARLVQHSVRERRCNIPWALGS